MEPIRWLPTPYIPLTIVSVVFLVSNGVVDVASVVVCAIVGIGLFRMLFSRRP